MGAYKGVSCVRCGHPLNGFHYDGCPACKKKGFNINFETKFDCSGMKLPPLSNKDAGIFRFWEFFALPANAPHVSIGEGNTPLYKLNRIGKKLGLNNLYMKDESKNPTMSHKDRMCSLIISKALVDKAQGVVISSTGNQGASTAAYCSLAGLPCVIFTTPNVSPSMKTWMQAYGAFVFMTPTMADRGIIMEKLVREMDYAPASGLLDPPIGSSCFAVDGYKTISFEVFEQLGSQAPDWFIVPISYGDTLYGISKGMHDLKEMGYISKLPRLVAAEVFHACENNIAAGNEVPVEQPSRASIQTSIATGKVTYQTVRAVRECNGLARTSKDDEALAMQQELAQTEGVFAEVSSCASLVVLKKLVAENKIVPDEKVVVLITSTGIKTPDVTQLYVPEIPMINPTIEDYKKALAESYHHSL